jgi:hypothetical protein
MDRALAMGLRTNNAPEHRPRAVHPDAMLGHAQCAGAPGSSGLVGPWGHGVARDTGCHGVRLAFVSWGFHVCAQRHASGAAGS